MFSPSPEIIEVMQSSG